MLNKTKEELLIPAEPNQKGGVPSPYPSPNQPPPAQDMGGIGKGPWPSDTTKGASEKDARAQAYRTLGTT